MAFIENWSIGRADSIKEIYLIGTVYGHKKLSDGEFIRTSKIHKLDFDNKQVKTKNTLYNLGTMGQGFKDYLIRNNMRLKDYETLYEEE